MTPTDNEDEWHSFLEPDEKSKGIKSIAHRGRTYWKTLAILLLASLALQTSVFVIWITRNQIQNSYGKDYFKPSIRLVERTFGSALHVDGNGTLFLDQNPDQPRFVNAPAAEIDRNWKDLISGRYFRLSNSETHWLKKAQSSTTDDTNNLFKPVKPLPFHYGGTDMYHSLHCLNALRKAATAAAVAEGNQIKTNTQYSKIQPNLPRLHLDHCIEQLRQAILCHGDLTPVTLRPVFHREANVLDLLGETEYRHTCRDWRGLMTALRGREGIEGDFEGLEG